MTTGSGPTVAVWKNKWLPSSETFIRDQMQHLSEWRAVRIGFTNLANGLPVAAQYAPYAESRPGQVLRLAAGTLPFRSGYRKVLRDSDASLIHAHFGSGGVNALPLARRNRLPILTTFHGTDATTYGARSRTLNQKYLKQLSVLFEDGALFIAVSRYVADRLIATGAPATRVRVLYTGTDVTVPPAIGLERTGILFAGRLVAKKGVADLLAAVAKLPPALRDTQVTIVGEGSERANLQSLAKDLRLNATFTGWMDSEQLDHEFRRHAVFCAPSHRTGTADAEGFGMVYIEAALREMPVVAYATGGTQEAVEHGRTGILVPERAVDDLSAALADALEPRTRAALGAAGRARAVEAFDVRVQTAKLESTYDELVGR